MFLDGDEAGLEFIYTTQFGVVLPDLIINKQVRLISTNDSNTSFPVCSYSPNCVVTHYDSMEWKPSNLYTSSIGLCLNQYFDNLQVFIKNLNFEAPTLIVCKYSPFYVVRTLMELSIPNNNVSEIFIIARLLMLKLYCDIDFYSYLVTENNQSAFIEYFYAMLKGYRNERLSRLIFSCDSAQYIQFQRICVHEIPNSATLQRLTIQDSYLYKCESEEFNVELYGNIVKQLYPKCGRCASERVDLEQLGEETGDLLIRKSWLQSITWA